jgi:hypothetical protein
LLPRWLDASSFIGHENGGLININAPFVPKNIKINILYCAKARLNDIVGQGAKSKAVNLKPFKVLYAKYHQL